MTTQGKRIFRNPRLTRQEEAKIRILFRDYEVPQTMLARRFNTSVENIRRVVNGK